MAIESLFGPSPEEILLARQKEQQQQTMLRNQQIAQQGQQFGVFAPLYQAGLRFGDVASQAAMQSLFPQQMDPTLQKATDVQSILSQYQGKDLTSSTVLKEISSDLAKKGYTNESLSLAAEAQQSAAREAALAKAAREERKALLSEAQEAKLREELAALGPNATDDQVLSVVTKYGNPDKIMAALSARQARQERMDMQRELAQQRLDIQRQGLEFRKDLQNTKLAEKDEKKQAAAESAISNAGRVIQTVTEAKSLVGPMTTGLGGYLAVLPASDARKLKNKLATIKANLGFDRLQQMRDASPTGGALGQVAVQEINFLQSTVDTLDQLESETDIKNALNKIEEYYANWKSALEGKMPAKYQTGGGAAAVPAATQAPQVAPAAPVTIPAGVTVRKVPK